MYEGHKVIACTPAGRRRSLETLLPYMLANRHIIDEWRLWVNTTTSKDVSWCRNAAEEYPGFIKLVWGAMPINPNDLPATIHQFFQGCIDPKTIYIRFDDDICWVHHEAVKELCRYRLENPVPFIVYANTVNNSICSHIHQRLGAIPLNHGIAGYDCLDRIGWGSGEFAVKVHEAFFDALKTNDLNRYLFSQWLSPLPDRISINCFAWLGSDFASFGGRVGNNEEEWLSVTHPRSLGLTTVILGSALVVHYAYHTQVAQVDMTPISDVYRAISKETVKERKPQGKEQVQEYPYQTVLYI